MTPPSHSASARYELCEPVSPRRWGLKAIGAFIVALATQDATAYYGGLRWRIRDRETGDYVYEVTTSIGGLDAQEARSSLSRDLERMNIQDFEREYSIDRRRDR